MAGAISAGAYTAGVVDFLTEALDRWELRKQQLRAENTPESEWDVPSHDVVIPVLSGASAGGMTCSIGMIAIAEQPMAAPTVTKHYHQVGDVEVRLPRLFRAWVESPCFVNDVGGSQFLGIDDLHDNVVRSVLDGTLLDDIGLNSVLGVGATYARPYFAEETHLYLTVTNLRGVPYEIGFVGSDAQAGYSMTSHGDRCHFVVTGVGAAICPSIWAGPDSAIQVPINTVPGIGAQPSLAALPSPWKEYITAALGTGAFPIGLPARVIGSITVKGIAERQWPVAELAGSANCPPQFRLPPALPGLGAGQAIGVQNPATLAAELDARQRHADQPVDYVAVDGGVINNEPFEMARWSLMTAPPSGNSGVGEDANSAVIMIDPFPEAVSVDRAAVNDVKLTGVLKKLLPTILNQARFKPGEIAAALDKSVYSRFLISPRRRSGGQVVLQSQVLACGLLGGFGGFLSELFRAHDYQLGRANCAAFLRDHFTVPSIGNVVAAGYGIKNPASYHPLTNGKPNIGFFQIIPLVPVVANAGSPPNPAPYPRFPDWPRVTRDVVQKMATQAGERASHLFRIAKTNQVAGRLFRLLASVGWLLVGKDKINKYVYWTTMTDLILRDQLEGEGYGGLPVAERKVLSALANPAYDYRTVLGICKEYELTESEVATTLGRHSDKIAEGARDSFGFRGYTLKDRVPTGIWSWSLVRWGGEQLFYGPPTIN